MKTHHIPHKIKGNRRDIAIIGCIHGTETLGIEVIELLKGTEGLKLIIANEEAITANRRYIDCDLNRCFPGRIDGNKEERLAVTILSEISDCEFVIDIHTTTAITENFIIQTKDDANILANAIPLNKKVIMGPCVAHEGSLIDNVSKGVSIEFNENTPSSDVFDIIITTLKNLEEKQTSDKEIFYVYGILKKTMEDELFNFKEKIIEQEKFYPILYGEKEYKEIICLKAKRLQ